MLANSQYRLAKIMRWAGRVIVLIIVVFFLIMLTGSAVSEGLEPITLEGATLGIIGVIALAGLVLSWWRERLAGILLIITSIGLAIHIGFFVGHSHALAWTIIGLPHLVAAVLILASWRLSRQMP